MKRVFSTIMAVLLPFALITAAMVSCRITAGAGAIADPNDLLPANNDISGFTKKGTPAHMTDSKSIYDAIDGAAEKYIQYGFIEGVQQMYTNGSSIQMDVHIFNQGNESNAGGIYREFYPSSPRDISREPYHAVIDESLSTSYRLYYYRENIYMEIFTSEKSDFALNTARQFFQNIDGKIITD